MKISSDFSDLLSLFNAKKVEYLIIGGVAVILYSEPRYTKDIDIWVNPTKKNSQRVFNALAEFGAPLKQLQITPDDFAQEGQFVQLGHEPVRVDILMSVKGLIFSEAWNRKVSLALGELHVHLLSREDLIQAKLFAGRPQDLMDAEALRRSAKFDSAKFDSAKFEVQSLKKK